MEDVVPDSDTVGGAVEGEYKPSHSGVPEPFTVIQYLFRVHFPGFEAGQVPVVIPECGHAVPKTILVYHPYTKQQRVDTSK